MQKNVIFLSILLITVFMIRLISFQSLPKYSAGETLAQDFTILSVPKTLFGSQIIDLNISNGQKLSLRTSIIPTLSYGDKVHVKGVISERTFQNRKILELIYPELSIRNGARNPILAVVFTVRQRIEEFFNSNLDNISSDLMLGIVFGIKTNFPSDFNDAIRNVGLLHIVAASGMNVTILVGFTIFTLQFILRRQTALIVTLLIIVFYCLLSGFSASIVRAGIMGGVGITAAILGRQARAIWVLFVTALIMLIFSPNLLFDVGFQLSFSATAGILLLKPIFDQKIKLREISSDLNTTLSAQAGTLPVMALTFGTFSILSVPVNLLVLWTIPILMIIGGIAAIVSFIFEPLGSIILYLCIPFILYIKFVITAFSKLPALMDLSNMPAVFFIGYYLILASLILYKRK